MYIFYISWQTFDSPKVSLATTRPALLLSDLPVFTAARADVILQVDSVGAPQLPVGAPWGVPF